MATNESWKLFDNEAALKPIRDARSEFEQQKKSDEFVKALFLQTPKGYPNWAKKTYPIDTLITELENLNTNMAETVGALTKENARMMALYAASQGPPSK